MDCVAKKTIETATWGMESSYEAQIKYLLVVIVLRTIKTGVGYFHAHSSQSANLIEKE